MLNRQNADVGEWCLNITYHNNGKTSEVIPQINLGLSRNDQDFLKELKFLKAGKVHRIREQYTALHGNVPSVAISEMKSLRFFKNPAKAKLNVIIRAYDDGITFRYEFPEKQGTFVVKDG